MRKKPEHWKNKSIQDIKGEVWKPVFGFENSHMISNFDRVKSKDRPERSGKDMSFRIRKGRMMSILVNTNGYLKVTIQHKGVKKFGIIHRMKAEAFIPNPENKPDINHKNGIKTDNSIDLNDLYGFGTNIEWATKSENAQHAYDYGLNVPRFGTEHHLGILSDEDVREIIKEYSKYKGVRDKRGIRNNLAKKYGITEGHVKQVALGFKRKRCQEKVNGNLL